MLFLARQAVEEYDRWMHGLYLTHSQGERRGKHQRGRASVRVNDSSLLQDMRSWRWQLSFISMRYLPVLPRLLVMNHMVQVAIAYMYCAKDTTNFSSFLLGAQLLCSLCVLYLIYNSKPSQSQHSECS